MKLSSRYTQLADTYRAKASASVLIAWHYRAAARASGKPSAASAYRKRRVSVNANKGAANLFRAKADYLKLLGE